MRAFHVFILIICCCAQSKSLENIKITGINIPKDSFKIVGGNEVEINQFPWQVSLQSRWNIYDHLCGGSIITPYKVLTAAHCVTFNLPQDLIIRIGSANRMGGGYLHELAKIVIHKDYNKPTLKNNDIAVLLLKHRMVYGPNVQPVVLPPSGFDLHTNATVSVSGWGTRREGNDEALAIHLRAVRIQIVDQQTCARIYEENSDEYIPPVTDNMLCAGIFGVGGKDACLGDSGGGAVFFGTNGVLYGIVSWGYGCGDAMHPGVYVRVSRYIEWINSIN